MMPEKEAGQNIILWACGSGSTVLLSVWGYMKFFLTTKWREDDRAMKKEIDSDCDMKFEKIDKKFDDLEDAIKKDFHQLKTDLTDEVTNMLNGFATVNKQELKNQREKINENTKRDEEHEKENKKDNEILHTRINDVIKESTQESKELRKEIVDGRAEQTAILTNILLELKGRG